MKCPKCGAENRQDANFCSDCGCKLERVCPNCGTRNPPGSKFCDECGHDLRKPKEAAAIDYEQPQSYTPKFLADKILTTPQLPLRVNASSSPSSSPTWPALPPCPRSSIRRMSTRSWTAASGS